MTQRLAVLLSAGVSPVSAWGYLLPPGRASGAEPGGTRGAPGAVLRGANPTVSATTGILRAAARAAAAGDGVADAIAGQARRQTLGTARGEARGRARRQVRGEARGQARNQPRAPAREAARSAGRAASRRASDASGQTESAWLGLAAAWQVATQAGAPLAGCLRELAASLRELGQVQRDLEVALAEPRATGRLVMVLPLIGILFGSLMGFDSLHTLFATVPGLVCLAGGGLLMLAAARWNRALVRRAAPTDLTPGLRLELMAIAMSGGGSIDRSRAIVSAATERYGIGSGIDDESTLARASGSAPAADPIERVLDLSTRAGVPAAELLRSEAEQLRRDARSAGQRRAATLSVTLMLPLGLCVLPAFMLVGVVPLLISVLSSTLATF
ncbi:type II secretion system F family protein [Cryobacterium sp. Y11]|uniref:type II secretion system F family protein n=1 Tax=Cryobacterium sp. Y11 TaxID=2045016 RepID=UPI0013050006|nr:type II secretion system F family protein [Cryobacterium sp. Y11]